MVNIHGLVEKKVIIHSSPAQSLGKKLPRVLVIKKHKPKIRIQSKLHLVILFVYAGI